MLCGQCYYADFANLTAQQIVAEDAVGRLYALVTSPPEKLSCEARRKMAFRGAYVLERIYFTFQEQFMPFAAQFCAHDFALCVDPSAKRHFGKIMVDLLLHYTPQLEELERIAEAAAQWAVDTDARPAVRIWAVEVLRQCVGRVEWANEVLHDIVATLSRDSRPSIECRMRKSWNPKHRA